MSMIYGFRVIDLKRKYFGDILSEEVINKKAKPKVKKEDESVERMLKEDKENIRRVYKDEENQGRTGADKEEIQSEYTIFME